MWIKVHLPASPVAATVAAAHLQTDELAEWDRSVRMVFGSTPLDRKQAILRYHRSERRVLWHVLFSIHERAEALNIQSRLAPIADHLLRWLGLDSAVPVVGDYDFTIIAPNGPAGIDLHVEGYPAGGRYFDQGGRWR